MGEPDQRKVQWTFRPANAAAARDHTRREAGTEARRALLEKTGGPGTARSA